MPFASHGLLRTLRWGYRGGVLISVADCLAVDHFSCFFYAIYYALLGFPRWLLPISSLIFLSLLSKPGIFLNQPLILSFEGSDNIFCIFQQFFVIFLELSILLFQVLAVNFQLLLVLSEWGGTLMCYLTEASYFCRTISRELYYYKGTVSFI